MDFKSWDSNSLLAMFYILSNIVATIIVMMLFLKSRKNNHTSSLYFKRLLNFLIIYYLGEILWAFAYYKIIPLSDVFIKISRMIYYSSAAFVAYNWLLYVEVFLDEKLVYNKKRKILYIPVITSVIVSIIICSFLDPAQKNWQGYLTALALITIPFAFVLDGCIRAIIKKIKDNDETLKTRYILLITWPIIILTFSLFQVFFAEMPIFSFGSAIITVALFIFNQDSLIFSDELTGIYNRKMLNSIIKSLSTKENYYVIMVDLNNFKRINDTYGHLEGDNALKFVAKKLLELIQEEGYFLARYGGDEFIIIARTDNLNEIKAFIKKINERLKSSKDSFSYTITASVGYCRLSEDDNLADAINKADEMLYEEKKYYHN